MFLGMKLREVGWLGMDMPLTLVEWPRFIVVDVRGCSGSPCNLTETEYNAAITQKTFNCACT